MNKTLVTIGIVAVVLVGGFYALNNYIYNEKQGETPENPVAQDTEIHITPVSHATVVLNWGGNILYADPVGGAEAFSGQPEPDLILVTDIHGDHLSTSTLVAVSKSDTVIVAPQAVAERFPEELPGTVVVLGNGQVTNQKGFSVQAIPMYNVPETESAPHTKGRGNGYVVEAGGQRVYIAGDTGNTEEMSALQDIDLAFVPMNLPYTMSVEDAAAGVLAFKPKRVVPYHYRGPNGLSDTNKFKELVNAGDSNIQVDLINFYPSN